MTNKEIKKLRDENPQFQNGIPCKLTPKQEKLIKELDCREMINSCLCYGIDFLKSEYKDDYIKDIGEDRVKEIYNEQLEDFKKQKF